MQELGEAWEQRPPGVAYFGTDRVRRLLGAGRAVVPRLRVGNSGVDWLSISAEWDAEGRRLSEADLARLREATTRFVKLDSGWVRKDVGDEQEALAAALADLGIDPEGGEQRLSVWQLAGAAPATLRTLEQVGGDADTLAVLRRLREQIADFTGIPEVPVPPGVVGELRPYQRLGLDFLVNAAGLGLGAVLADDMGLGKTVQALVWLLHLQEHDPAGGPTLVVCPASVVHNWAREAERFTPGLRVLLLTSGKTRHALRDEIPHHDLVVTTYALLRRDIEAWRTVALRAAILDEAQFIKNPDAAVSRAALELNARHRLALTGTPLENRALDLWSIMAFVNPGYLGTRSEFSARYDRTDAPPHARALLAAKLRPVLLRRTKQAVAPELPPRIEERRDCELTAEQRQLYVNELQRSRALLTQVSEKPGGVGSNKITILAALTRLRQICCHPALAGGRAGLGSGKFDALFEVLEPILAEGHKVLVFSQFVQCIKLIAAELRARGISYHQLTGQTTKREQVVAAFQEDPQPSVFLISLKAGGTGLNLTAASYVVLFDPWWNPAVEAQAIDRTHRIGQDRTVIAYRLLTRGTIEEKIWQLQQRKAALVQDVLGESGFARALTRDDLEFLLTDA
jgi:SNF2 family DNA or RNA helicase